VNALFGSPGGGKSHLGAAVGLALVENGWRVLFARTTDDSTIARGLDYVHQLCVSEATRIDVVSMSMGGLPSQAWADAINALYEAGVVVVTAAGNNYGNAPTRFVVYPARFGRVIAAVLLLDAFDREDAEVGVLAADLLLDVSGAALPPAFHGIDVGELEDADAVGQRCT
jgi:subtilisin family serine protease